MRISEIEFYTGNKQVDNILQGVIGIYETVFPGQIKAYYLTGSYAHSDAVPTSDIDLNVIFRDEQQLKNESEREDFGMLLFKNTQQTDEEKKFWLVTNYLKQISSIELGIMRRTEGDIRKRISPGTKIDNIFLYGEDFLRESNAQNFTVKQSDFPVRELMHIAYNCLCSTYSTEDVLSLPLKYPAPEEEFFGYAREKTDDTGRRIHSMDKLFSCVFPPSTALIALKAGKRVSKKSEISKVYRKYIDDKWNQFIEEVFDVCRGKWYYLIPEEEKDQRRLRNTCKKVLRFNTHFIEIYKKFLISELSGIDGDSIMMGVMMLQKKFFNDLKIIAVLRSLRNSDDKRIRGIVNDIMFKRNENT